jgi:hypothetical protein
MFNNCIIHPPTKLKLFASNTLYMEKLTALCTQQNIYGRAPTINCVFTGANVMKYFHQFTTVLAVTNKNLCYEGPVEI